MRCSPPHPSDWRASPSNGDGEPLASPFDDAGGRLAVDQGQLDDRGRLPVRPGETDARRLSLGGDVPAQLDTVGPVVVRAVVDGADRDHGAFTDQYRQAVEA